MNKLLTKIVGVALGATMAIGVGVAAVKASDGGMQRAEATAATMDIASNVTVNSKDGYKYGTGKVSGTANITIGAGATSLSFKAVGWKGESLTLTPSCSGVTFSPTSVSLTSYDAISGSGSTFTNISEDEYEFIFSALDASKTISLSATSGKRFILWEVTYGTGSAKTVNSLEVLDDEANELSDGDELNATLVSGNRSAHAFVTCDVTYSDSSHDDDVSISSNPSSGFGVGDSDNGTYEMTFTKNGDYDVTIASTLDPDNYAITVTYHVSGIISRVFEKVTAASTLAAGKEFIIAKSDGTSVLGKYVSGNNCPALTSTPDQSGKLDESDLPEGYALFTLGGSEGDWVLSDQDDKIYYGTSGNNYLKANTSSSDTWSISIASGNATITSKASSRSIKKNSTNALFATYASGQDNVSIYAVPSLEPAISVEITSGRSALGLGEEAVLEVTRINGATGTVNWSTNNSNVSLSATTGDSITVTASALGDATVTASLTGCANANTAFTITKGSASAPFTVAEARSAIDAGGDLTNRCATGIICQIDSYNSTYQSITYWISDDGTLTNKLEVYGGLGLNSEGFDSIDDIQIGAIVIIRGNLKKYDGEYEFDKNNYLLSYVAPDYTLSAITGLEGELTADAGDPSWDLSVLTPKGNLSNGQTNVDISAYVDVTTSDVPGNPETTTTRKVSVTVTPKDQSLSALTQTYQVDGTINVLSGPVYTKVTNASDLSAGDSVAIVAADYDYAMSTTQNNNNRGQAAVVKDGNSATLSEDVQIFTLVEGTVDNSYGFDTGSGYIYAASSSSNHLKTENTLSANSSFTIEIGEDAVATLTAQGTNTRNTIFYNSSNNPPIFSCYASDATQKAVSIYKAASSSEYTAADFAKELLKQTKGLCNADYDGEDNHDALAAIWSTLSGSNYWGKVSNQSALTGGTADSSVVVPTTDEAIDAMTDTAAIGAALYRYDFCTDKYNLTDFMGRVDGTNRINPINKVNNTVAIVVVVTISLVSVSALGAYFLLRKKKEER